MEKLSTAQQQQIKKFRVKLVALGYEEEAMMTWEREELIARYAEAMATGVKPKVEPAGGDPRFWPFLTFSLGDLVGTGTPRDRAGY